MMRRLLTTLMLVFAGLSPAYANHDDGRGYATAGYRYGGTYDIARAAHQLEYAAGRFHEQVKYASRRDRDIKDARRLAREAREFHRAVEKGRDHRRIRNDFADLSRAFEEARREYARSWDWRHGRHTRADFRPVERAFANLDRAIYVAMRADPRHRDHDRYAVDRHSYRRPH